MAARILAAIALYWIVHRALVQSITLDEALTFLFWVHPSAPTHWEPHSNNHILNSILMRLSIGLMGLSHFSTRAPALLGGALYIFGTYRLSIRLASTPLLQCIILACFLFNPFVMDYMVAARGYGLALGFLALTLDTLARILDHPSKPIPTAIALSCFSALGLAANFSWAYANAILTLTTLAILAKTTCPNPGRFLAASTLPGIAILVLFCGPALWDFPRHQLFWGSHDFRETLIEFERGSFDRLNPHLTNELVIRLLEPIRNHARWALVAFFALAIPTLARTQSWRRTFALTVGGSLALAAFIHWLQFIWLQIPLPYERTSLFAIPMFTAVTSAMLTALDRPGFARAARTAGAIMLALFAIYFTATLRDSHFKEWAICADIRAAYPVIEAECRRTNTRLVISDLNYTPSLNYYRILNQTTTIDEFPNHDRPPETGTVYVLPRDLNKAFIERHRLRTVFQSTLSDFAVLVRDPAK